MVTQQQPNDRRSPVEQGHVEGGLAALVHRIHGRLVFEQQRHLLDGEIRLARVVQRARVARGMD